MTFDKAVEQALADRKYDILTGRTIDLKEYLMDQIKKLIINLLENLSFPKLNLSNYNINIILNIILNIFIVMIVIIIISIIGITIYFINKRNKQNKNMEELLTEIINKSITFEDLIKNGQSYSTQKNYREAIRYYYLAILLLFNNYNIIYIHKAKTNKQFKREVKENAPQVNAQFSKIVETFNIAYFGHKHISDQNFDEFLTTFEFVIKEAEKYEQKF